MLLMEALVSEDDDELGRLRRSARTDGEILVVLSKIEATQNLHHSQNITKFEGLTARLDIQNGRIGKSETKVDGIEKILAEQALKDSYHAGVKVGQSQTIMSRTQLGTLISIGTLVSVVVGLIVRFVEL